MPSRSIVNIDVHCCQNLRSPIQTGQWSHDGGQQEQREGQKDRCWEEAEGEGGAGPGICRGRGGASEEGGVRTPLEIFVLKIASHLFCLSPQVY